MQLFRLAFLTFIFGRVSCHRCERSDFDFRYRIMCFFSFTGAYSTGWLFGLPRHVVWQLVNKYTQMTEFHVNKYFVLLNVGYYGTYYGLCGHHQVTFLV
jgi:hypothetical protein